MILHNRKLESFTITQEKPDPTSPKSILEKIEMCYDKLRKMKVSQERKELLSTYRMYITIYNDKVSSENGGLRPMDENFDPEIIERPKIIEKPQIIK